MTIHQKLTEALLDTKALETMASKFSCQDFYPKEDLIQDTILTCFEKETYIKEETNVKGWVYMIMKNTFINNYRRHTLHEIRVDSIEVKDEVYEPDYNKVLEHITNDDRFKLIVKFAHGYKYKELSNIFNMNIGTVRSNIFHQRKKLNKIFSHMA